MKKTSLICVLLVFFIATPILAFDPDNLNLVRFRNRTSKTIEFIFISPGDSEYWGPEILGSERTLKRGASIGFYILYPNSCDNFDIMAIDEEGGTFTLYDYEICDGTEEFIEFYDQDLDEEKPDFDFVEIMIKNETLPIYWVFISPSDSEMWGVDFLDENTILESDNTFHLLFPAGVDPTTYDLLGVDEDYDSYMFSFDVDSDSNYTQYSIEMSDLQ